MLHRFLLLLFCLASSLDISAQDWKTVRSNDSVYFIGGHVGGTPGGRNLKIIWIASSQASGADSAFYFYKTLRDTNGSCMDTMGATWLGKKMLRLQNGDELYFNRYDDTILVKTQAAVGSSWIIAKSVAGRNYQATITQAGVTTVDGVTDSFKTISIQAFQNGQPVTDWYNSVVLELSKNHGWLKALDFYLFPNDFLITQFAGAVVDKHQQIRLPAVFDKGLNYEDVTLKYQAGNAWVKQYIYNTNGSGTYYYDSVVSSQQLAPGVVQAVVTTATVTVQSFGSQPVYTYGPPTTSAGVFTSNSPGSLLSSGVLPEYIGQDTLHSPYADNLHLKTILVDSVCNGSYLRVSYFTPAPFLNMTFYPPDNCYKTSSNISGYIYHDSTFLPGFGKIMEAKIWDPSSTFLFKTHYPYIKLNNCVIGHFPHVLQGPSPHAWKTVLLNDSTYFAGGSTSWTSEKLLKIIWVDSATASGGDSSFYFYRTIRDTVAGACMDTLGPSWLGKKMIRQSNGDEYYFNRHDDTILIKTHAPVGSSWVLAKSIHGRVYEGTVTQSGLMTVDGVSDSFKTISIQAFENSIPVNDWYNNFVLQLSKAHGWIKALDFYVFPNRDITVLQTGAVPDTAQQVRLPKSFNATCLEDDDLLLKYAPGNEWIEEVDAQPYNYLGFMQSKYSIRFDSIISSAPLSANLISVTRKVVSYYKFYYQMTTSNSGFQSYVETIVIPRCPGSKVIDSLLPDNVGDFTFTPPHSIGYKTWYIDTLCNGNMYKVKAVSSFSLSHFTISPNCISANNALSYPPYREFSYLLGFGLFSEYYRTPLTWDSYFSTHTYHSYIKLGNCTYGAKKQILNIDPASTVAHPISISPNPAREFVLITGLSANQSAEVSIYDPTGRLVVKKLLLPAERTIDISSLSPNMYILHIRSDGNAFVRKLTVLK